MTINDIRHLYKADEFKPFVIELKTEHRYLITNPDYIWITPTGTVHLFITESEQHMFGLDRINQIVIEPE